MAIRTTVHPIPLGTAARALSAAVMALMTGLSAQAQAPAAGDRALGEQIATQGMLSKGVPACTSCHGMQGEGFAIFPRLAATGADYLRAQLDAFADGSRANLTMPFAQSLTPEDRAALALYYSQLPPPSFQITPSEPSPADTGAWLATRGRWSDDLPACAQCHGPDGIGVGAHFPPLAGLPQSYIAEQLQAWKAGTRPPGPLQLMSAVAAKLSDSDIQAVSAHYASIAVQAASPAAVVPKEKTQ